MDRQKPEREDQREHGFGEKSDFRLAELKVMSGFKKRKCSLVYLR